MSYKAQVVIVGQGYVGLPLSIAAAEAGFKVLGVDIDSTKVNHLNSRRSVIEDISDNQVALQIDKGCYRATTDFSELSTGNIIVVCVPTPLNADHKPDLTYLQSASQLIAKYVKNEALLILESTVAPGTTRNLFAPIFNPERRPKDKSIYIAYSPERIDPRSNTYNIKNTPKIVSGLTHEAMKKASDFYSKFIETVIECDSVEVAETSKLLENSFRLINISFINELSIFCYNLGVDINKVIEAAASKPFGYMPFYPSLGAGGHCIPVDPIYLKSKAQEIGAPVTMIEQAEQINSKMPEVFTARAAEKLGGLSRKKVLVVGVAYKANVSDVRETPVEALIFGLRQQGAEVLWHDDLVKTWLGEKSVSLSNNFDLAIIATPHDYLDLTKLGNIPILNTRGSI